MENFSMEISVLLLLIVFAQNATSTTTKFFDAAAIVQSQVRRFVLIAGYYKGTPYTKFRATRHRLTFCAFSREQKLAVCYALLSSPRYQYKFSPNVHPNLACRRIAVETGAGKPTARISAFKCPTAHVKLAGAHPARRIIHVPVSYYVLGSGGSFNTIVYYRHLGPHAQFKPDFSTKFEPTASFWRMIAAQRARPYVSAFTCRHLDHDVQPYRVETWSFTKHRAPEYVETLMTYFVRHVKRNKSPYLKFRITYDTINVCGLHYSEVKHVCAEAFDDDEFDYSTENSFMEHNKCWRQTVYFNYVKFPPSMVHVIGCGQRNQSSATKKLYFASMGVLPTSILGLIRYTPHPETLADVVVQNIEFDSFDDDSDEDFTDEQQPKRIDIDGRFIRAAVASPISRLPPTDLEKKFFFKI